MKEGNRVGRIGAVVLAVSTAFAAGACQESGANQPQLPNNPQPLPASFCEDPQSLIAKLDMDCDGVFNNSDRHAFLKDPWLDADRDWIHDNSDLYWGYDFGDDDGDGLVNWNDEFPHVADLRIPRFVFEAPVQPAPQNNNNNNGQGMSDREANERINEQILQRQMGYDPDGDGVYSHWDDDDYVYGD